MSEVPLSTLQRGRSHQVTPSVADSVLRIRPSSAAPLAILLGAELNPEKALLHHQATHPSVIFVPRFGEID